MSVARRVDTDADATGLVVGRWRGGRVLLGHKTSVGVDGRNASREGPPVLLDREEACDERSGRPASRSNKLWARHGGVNLQPEVAPHQT